MTDSVVAGGGRDDARTGFGNISKISKRAGWAVFGAATVLMLLAPAIWNGFPLIFPDTGGYLMAAMTGTPMHGRSALYAVMRPKAWPRGPVRPERSRGTQRSVSRLRSTRTDR